MRINKNKIFLGIFDKMGELTKLLVERETEKVDKLGLPIRMLLITQIMRDLVELCEVKTRGIKLHHIHS